jgi:hypothetical protein
MESVIEKSRLHRVIAARLHFAMVTSGCNDISFLLTRPVCSAGSRAVLRLRDDTRSIFWSVRLCDCQRQSSRVAAQRQYSTWPALLIIFITLVFAMPFWRSIEGTGRSLEGASLLKYRDVTN